MYTYLPSHAVFAPESKETALFRPSSRTKCNSDSAAPTTSLGGVDIPKSSTVLVFLVATVASLKVRDQYASLLRRDSR